MQLHIPIRISMLSAMCFLTARDKQPLDVSDRSIPSCLYSDGPSGIQVLKISAIFRSKPYNFSMEFHWHTFSETSKRYYTCHSWRFSIKCSAVLLPVQLFYSYFLLPFFAFK